MVKSCPVFTDFTCYLLPSSIGPGFYFDSASLVDLTCPPGLGFNQTECGCTDVIGNLTRGEGVRKVME